MTSRHAIPKEVELSLDAIEREIVRIRTAATTGQATLGGLRLLEQAAVRLRNAAPALVTAARRVRLEAEREERRRAAMGPEVIDERIAALRAEARRSDLAIPAMPA